MSDKYDVIVIGGGPAGYVAAIRCAQLGFKTVCVEKWLTADHKPALGGTCLNVGCIPSKALLSITHHYHHLLQHGEQSGIIHQGLTIDISKMMSQKQAVVKKLTAGIEGLFMANKVTWLKGSGQLLSTHRVQVTTHDNQQLIIEAHHIILATGSRPIEIPPAPLSAKKSVDLM